MRCDLKTLLKGAVLGGLVFFFWGNISWMVIGWHKSYMLELPNEEVFSNVIKQSVPKNGLYVIPYHDGSDHEAAAQKMQEGPFAYMALSPQGLNMNMLPFMLRSIFFNMFMAMLATFLLLQIAEYSFFHKVLFVKMIGLSAGIWTIFSNWNWWNFPGLYLVINFFDVAIAWGLMGVVLSKFVVKKTV